MTYQQGSFRGLPFLTESASVRGGQRRAVYEVPFDDSGAASVNLGRKPRRYSITAFLLQRPPGSSDPARVLDLEVAARAFLQALEQPGPGLLVHPHLGPVMVLPDPDVSIHFSTAEGGKASISFEAVESRAKAAAAPLAQTNTRADLPRATSAVRTANKEAFSKKFDLSTVTDFVRDANRNSLVNVLQNLRRVNGLISSVLSVPGQLGSQIDAVSLQLTDLLDTPDKLYDAMGGLIDTVYNSIGRVASRFGIDVRPDAPDVGRADAFAVSARSLKLAIQGSDLSVNDLEPGQRNTPAREVERKNNAAIRQAMNAAAAAALSDAANELDLPAQSDNTLVRDLLLEALDALLLQDVEPAVADALYDLRAAVWSRFTGRGATITEFVPGDNMPADVIAWQLYGDAERADEIVARNALPDPGQVQGFVPIEVLSS